MISNYEGLLILFFINYNYQPAPVAQWQSTGLVNQGS